MRTVHVHAYERRRPQKPDAYRTLHNRLYDEVRFMEAMRLQDELADAIASELEQAEEHSALAGRR
jgi:hypothetical protein